MKIILNVSPCYFASDWFSPRLGAPYRPILFSVEKKIHIIQWNIDWGPTQELVLVLVAESYLTLRPPGLQPDRFLCPWNFSGKNTEVGWHSLLQGIFPAQGRNLGLLHCRRSLYRLNHKGSPVGGELRPNKRRFLPSQRSEFSGKGQSFKKKEPLLKTGCDKYYDK